jgi:hypothetical protein
MTRRYHYRDRYRYRMPPAANQTAIRLFGYSAHTVDNADTP